MRTVELSTALYLANRERLTGWVTAHGVVPERVPLPSTITIDGLRVTFEQFGVDDAGRVRIENDRPVKTTVTVPLVMPWPDDLMPTE